MLKYLNKSIYCRVFHRSTKSPRSEQPLKRGGRPDRALSPQAERGTPCRGHLQPPRAASPSASKGALWQCENNQKSSRSPLLFSFSCLSSYPLPPAPPAPEVYCWCRIVCERIFVESSSFIFTWLQQPPLSRWLGEAAGPRPCPGGLQLGCSPAWALLPPLRRGAVGGNPRAGAGGGQG